MIKFFSSPAGLTNLSLVFFFKLFYFLWLDTPPANVSVVYVCEYKYVHLRSLAVTAAKYVDYVFQGAGSEEAIVSEDRSLWPLWPRLLPMGGAQKTQILNLLSFSPPRLVGVYYREASKVPGVKCPNISHNGII